jgi:Cd2+/Zn2+-exporting ATPase
MNKLLTLELAEILPAGTPADDGCVARLVQRVQQVPGVDKVELAWDAEGRGSLMVKYRPESISVDVLTSDIHQVGEAIARQFAHETFVVRAVESEDAGRRIEEAVRTLPGVTEASVNLAAQVVRVEFDRVLSDRARIETALNQMGYRTGHSVPSPGWYSRNRELAWSLGSGLLLIIAWSGVRWLALPGSGAIALYLGAYGLGAWDLVRHWVSALKRGKVSLDIDLLMLLAAVGAAILGEWAEGAFLLFLFSLAHSLEHYALGRARQAIRALADLAPPIARVRRGNTLVEVRPDEVEIGDTVLVRPGDRIPVDGTVASGTSTVNQAPITGESMPVEKVAGGEVYAGTVNGEGVLEITTTKASGDRTLDRVIKLVEEAQAQKAPTQALTEKFERIFVPVVLVADVLLIVIPPLLGFWTWEVSFYRGMAMLVAASPCALALGTPATVLTGIAQAARRGVLIKGGAHLETLGALKVFALDKTGTLTMGEPAVTQVRTHDGSTEREVLEVAAAVERGSQHPLAIAVVRRAEADRLPQQSAQDVQSVTGRGIRATVQGETVEIGSPRMWDGAVAIPEALGQQIEQVQAQGNSVLVVRRGQRWLGVIGVADRPREGVREVLTSLRRMGLGPIVMLSGDNAGVAKAIGAQVGVDEVRADLLPEDKVKVVRDLQAQHGRVAMVGDGVNDAPALAFADVGIAMGGAGTAAALETADVALMADDLGRLPFAVGLSRQARRIIRQNLLVSLAVIALLLVTTVSGIFGIGAAVFVHEGSTLVVVANALRLLSFGSS